MQVALYHVQDVDRLRARRIEAGAEVIVGRGPGATLQIDDDPLVAPRHVRIEETGSLFRATPLDGATMLVNGVAYTFAMPISRDDLVQVGETVLRVAASAIVRIDDAPTTPMPVVHMPANPPLVQRVPRPPAVSRDVLSADPTEHQFLERLRLVPNDAGTRIVYGDWLEQRGDLVRAAHVRTASADSTALVACSDASWRAITSRASLEELTNAQLRSSRCTPQSCPSRWDRLEASPDDERVRHCTVCRVAVRYCTTTSEAAYSRGQFERQVLDPAVSKRR